MIVAPARWKALRMAMRSVAPRSVLRATARYTSTLLSTAMPTVRARAGEAGQVKAALMVSMMATSISMFSTRAMLATMPAEAVVPEHEQRHEDRRR